MARKIVSTGRGGVGKSTFVALAARYLHPPLLLIDLDPDQCLPEMVGVDLERAKVATVSSALYDIIEERRSDASPGSMALPERMAYLLQAECLYEGEKFDLIALGTKLTKGCYCVPDELLKLNIPRLAKNYANVLIDSPAGLEHLNRKVFSDINDLFVLLDPSSKSMQHIGRVEAITGAIGLHYNHLYLVGNHRFEEGLEERIQSTDGIYLGRIEYDAKVEEYNLNGRSLLGLPDDSPACLSVKRILERAGYGIKEDKRSQAHVILSYNM